jgi:uncharacterized membrane protein YcaP (DUF421 family)
MDIVIRASITFAALYLLLRLLGKREIGQLSPFELVLLIVMGDLAQQGVTHNDFSLTGSALAVGAFAFWGVVLSWVVYLFPKLKGPLEGEPRIIVREGRYVEQNLHRDRLTRGEIESEMRLAGIAHLSEVAWAVLEPQGKISFVKRQSSPGETSSQEDDSKEP